MIYGSLIDSYLLKNQVCPICDPMKIFAFQRKSKVEVIPVLFIF